MSLNLFSDTIQFGVCLYIYIYISINSYQSSSEKKVDVHNCWILSENLIWKKKMKHFSLDGKKKLHHMIFYLIESIESYESYHNHERMPFREAQINAEVLLLNQTNLLGSILLLQVQSFKFTFLCTKKCQSLLSLLSLRICCLNLFHQRKVSWLDGFDETFFISI